MGKLVEAEAFVPRHREIAYVELAVEPEVVKVGQVMSRGEMLEKLVVKSPTAAIKIGVVPVGCVLDTGAGSSLMPSSFNEKNLAGVAGLVNVGTFMRIVGGNGLGVPFEGGGGKSVVETDSVAVSPPGGSSDPGEEVSELTAASVGVSPPGDSSDPGEEVSELTVRRSVKVSELTAASVGVSPPGDSSDPGEEVSELTAASVGVSPPGDSSDPGEEVSELTAASVSVSPPGDSSDPGEEVSELTAASVGVSPPGDSSDPGEEVSELTAASVGVSPPGDSSDPGEEVSELTAASVGVSPPGDSSDPGEEVSELTAASVGVSPPGDSSDPGEEVSELTAVTYSGSVTLSQLGAACKDAGWRSSVTGAVCGGGVSGEDSRSPSWAGYPACGRSQSFRGAGTS